MALARYLKRNFETLCRAVSDGNVAIMECQLAATEEVVGVICAVNRLESGETEFVPFAMLFTGDPYQTVNPPDADGGFHAQAEMPSTG